MHADENRKTSKNSSLANLCEVTYLNHTRLAKMLMHQLLT